MILIDLGKNNLSGSLETIFKACRELRRVPSPHRKLFQESPHNSGPLSVLRHRLNAVATFYAIMSNLLVPKLNLLHDHDDDEVIVQRWCEAVAKDNSKSQFINSVLSCLPELRITAKELWEREEEQRKVELEEIVLKAKQRAEEGVEAVCYIYLNNPN